MNWKRYFTATIISRGQNYYRKGAVKNLRKQGGRFYADVMGSLPYSVSIWKKANGQLSMSCNCMHAFEGNYCKHMAAVWIAMEKEYDVDTLQDLEKQPAQNSNKPVKPFTRRNIAGAKEYTCYDLSIITDDIKITQTQLEQAKRLLEKNIIQLRSVSEGFVNNYYGGYEPACDVYADYADEHGKNEVHICITRRSVINASCRVPNCMHYYGSYYYSKTSLCKHQLAVLLLLDDYIDEYNPGDTTGMQALRLMEEYRNQKRGRKLEKSEMETYDLKIEPRIEYTENGLEMAIRAGVQKLFVVKNLSEFVDNVENRKIQKFGSKTEIDFGIHRICEESEPYYDFLKRKVTGEQLRYDSMGYYAESVVSKGRIYLYGIQLDEMFDIIMQDNRKIPYQDKCVDEKYDALNVENGSPNLQLRLTTDFENGVLRGILVSGELPELIKGERFVYCLVDENLYRIDDEKMRILLPLYDMAEDDRIRFHVGRKSMVDFYYHTLPMISECVDIVDGVSGELEKYLPPKAEFKFYLDEEEGKILCEAKAVYGEKEVSIVENPNEKINKRQERDLYAESEVADELLRYCPQVDMARGVFTCEGDDDICTLLETGVNELMSYGSVLCTDRVKRIHVRKHTSLTVGVSLKSGIMELDVMSEDMSSKELLELLASYRRKKKYHRLSNGDFVNTEDENIGILASMFDSMHIPMKEILNGKIQLPVYRALYLDKILEKKENLYVERDRHFKNLIKEFKTVEDSEFEVPVSLRKILRPYQVTGFKWLKTVEMYGFGGVLADDMGLGKTLQMISVLVQAKAEHKEGTSLIVTPASLIYNWKEEFQKFAPALKTLVVSGVQSERKKLIEQYNEHDVLITSYDLLKRDIAEYEDKKFLYQIVDEAQYIKNHSTAAAKSVKCIQSQTKFALTGTPIENRLSELWSIFDYLMPGFLYGYETFRKELETPIAKNRDEAASMRLKRMVSPFIMRRLKQDVLTELPDKLEEIQYTKFEEKQQRLYDGQVTHMREILNMQSNEEFAQNKLQILSELTKLREICCDPALLFDNYDGESAKRNMCVDLMKRAIEAEHRILVFSQFTSMLSLLEQDLEKEGISFYKITGATKKEERIRLVKKFNEGDVPVFLISLKAGGTGLNLTGADTVIHYDPWWNQAAQNQATDRAHRIGQKKVVTVYKLIAKGSIEEKILKMQEMKKNLADEILSGETGGLSRMSKDELLELLGE